MILLQIFARIISEMIVFHQLHNLWIDWYIFERNFETHMMTKLKIDTLRISINIFNVAIFFFYIKSWFNIVLWKYFATNLQSYKLNGVRLLFEIRALFFNTCPFCENFFSNDLHHCLWIKRFQKIQRLFVAIFILQSYRVLVVL